MKIKLFKNVNIPVKSHLPDSGLDIFTPETFSIESLETKTIPLGFGVSIPEGFAGMIVPRSSIAEKGLVIQTAVIDPDYAGEIHLIITNASKDRYTIEQGTRLCSLIVYSILNPYVEIVDELPSSYRHSAGLGSTGK